MSENDWLDRLDDDALAGYLKGAAIERRARFVVEQRNGEWVAEFRTDNELAGEFVSWAIRRRSSPTRS